MGEYLEHSSIEIIIESRLPIWMLDKVYQQKGPEVLPQSSSPIQTIVKATSFCNEDQWDDECQVYQTAKQRMERLKTIEECLNCLQKGHITNT
ncbi:hypothetical protein LOAG_19085, partial [Loa loa]